MEHPAPLGLDWIPQNAKSETARSALGGPASRGFSWKGNICFKSFEEKLYKHVGMAWCVDSLLKELPEEGGNRAPKTEATQLPWLRRQRQFWTL